MDTNYKHFILCRKEYSWFKSISLKNKFGNNKQLGLASWVTGSEL